MLAAIVYQQVNESSAADDLDVLVQKEQVAAALRLLGHKVIDFPATLNLEALKIFLLEEKPDICFNLVESLDGSGQFVHFAPAVLERLHIPFTGSGAEALYLTTNKILAKERMRQLQVDTPAWIVGEKPPFDPPYIVKPISEDASVAIDEDMVVSKEKDLAVLLERTSGNRPYFIEQYIAGREFNLSLLASAQGPQVLPPAEMLFNDYPLDKPQVVGYRAKWQQDSFEFSHTVRRFDYPPKDANLLRKLTEIALTCWHAFQLRGYARVDFRVDKDERPWVLEINANPCISPDSGFVAAATKACLSFESVVQRVVADSFFPNS